MKGSQTGRGAKERDFTVKRGEKERGGFGVHFQLKKRISRAGKVLTGGK